MAESIVRISRELEEAQAQIAVYEAERTILQRERDNAMKALRQIASMDTSHDASPQQCGAVLIAMNALEARQ